MHLCLILSWCTSILSMLIISFISQRRTMKPSRQGYFKSCVHQGMRLSILNQCAVVNNFYEFIFTSIVALTFAHHHIDWRFVNALCNGFIYWFFSKFSMSLISHQSFYIIVWFKINASGRFAQLFQPSDTWVEFKTAQWFWWIISDKYREGLNRCPLLMTPFGDILYLSFRWLVIADNEGGSARRHARAPVARCSL